MHTTIRTLLIIGCLIAALQSYPASPDEISDLANKISQQADTPEKVESMLLLSQYLRIPNSDSSLLLCDQAFDLSEKIGYSEGKADALYKKSLAFKSIGSYAEALEYGESSLSLYYLLNDSIRIAKALFNIGNLNRITSEINLAIDYYKKSLAIYNQVRDTSSLISVYNSIGQFYEQMAKYDSAATYYHKAIHYCEAINRTKALGRILGNLGNTYMHLGDFDNSLKFLSLGLEYDILYEDIYNIPTAYARLGALYHENDSLNKAREYYFLSDSVYAITGDVQGIYYNYINHANILIRQGKYDEALRYQNKSIKYFRQQDLAVGMIAAWQGMASVYAKKGLPKKAHIYYDSCMILANETHNLYRKKEILQESYLIYKESGSHEDALLAFTRLQEVKDSIFNLEEAEIINDLLFKYEKEKDQLKILNLENENLKKLKERNLLLFSGLGILLIALFAIFFIAYKNRKNHIISNHRIKQLEEEKKHMAARFLVEGQENERKRVALELHDNLGVLLSATKMQFTAIKDKSPENEELILKATKFLEQASTDVRKISHNLMPGLLTKLGLFEALEDLFETLDETDGIDAKMDVVGPQKRYPENSEIMIYRMLQEIVNNSIKHSGADKYDLTLVVHPDELDISYSDNGKGFDVKEVLSMKSMGIQSIRSRVKFLDGNIKIDSAAGKGTVYRICIPLDPGQSRPVE